MLPESALLSIAVNLVRALTAAGIAQPAVTILSQTDAVDFYHSTVTPDFLFWINIILYMNV